VAAAVGGRRKKTHADVNPASLPTDASPA
jgi:hypothetical protein